MVYLANAASFLAPLTMLLWPLRRIAGRAVRPQDRDGAVAASSYRALLRDGSLLALVVLNFLTAFVGYAQMQSGMTAYGRLVGEVSTQVIGLAFGANTATIVLLQLFVLRRIESHRRSRVILLMCLVWALSWLCLGVSGLVPGTAGATVLVVAAAGVFGLGETLLQPTIPAITNDLAPDHLRGRYNALMAAASQGAAIAGPVVAGVMLGRQWNAAFIGMLVGGCAAMALLVLRVVEPRIPAHANGVGPSAGSRPGADGS